jgi:N-carbamoylputrescine amidase
MQEIAKQHGMVIVVPIYEEEQTGVYYNSAAVIDADGSYLGKYRKTHIPHVARVFGKSFISAGQSWISVFRYCVRAASEYTSVTIGIFPRVQDASG